MRYTDDDLVVVWEDDDEGCVECECGSLDCPCYTREPHQVEGCLVYDADEYDEWEKRCRFVRRHRPIPLDSLWGICEATGEYRTEMEEQVLKQARHERDKDRERALRIARAITVMVP